MSNSLVLMHSRTNDLHIIDPDCVPHTDDLLPIMEIALAVANAGYEGIALEEIQLANGKYIQSLEVNFATPEGQIFQKLARIMEADRKLPNTATVLESIRRLYGMPKFNAKPTGNKTAAHSIVKENK